MTNIESLRSLQKRIREANGADRKLDAEIAIALGLVSGAPWEIFTDRLGERTARNSMSGTEVLLRDFGRYIKLPKLTSDPDGLGSCVALMREVLPGWSGSVSWNNLETNGGTSFAYVHTPIGYDGPYPCPEGSLHHNNTCLALLYAIVSALIAQEERASLIENGQQCI